MQFLILFFPLFVDVGNSKKIDSNQTKNEHKVQLVVNGGIGSNFNFFVQKKLGDGMPNPSYNGYQDTRFQPSMSWNLGLQSSFKIKNNFRVSIGNQYYLRTSKFTRNKDTMIKYNNTDYIEGKIYMHSFEIPIYLDFIYKKVGVSAGVINSFQIYRYNFYKKDSFSSIAGGSFQPRFYLYPSIRLLLFFDRRRLFGSELHLDFRSFDHLNFDAGVKFSYNFFR